MRPDFRGRLFPTFVAYAASFGQPSEQPQAPVALASAPGPGTETLNAQRQHSTFNTRSRADATVRSLRWAVGSPRPEGPKESSKHEIRNPKQIQSSKLGKIQNGETEQLLLVDGGSVFFSKRWNVPGWVVLNLGFGICFGFRISCLPVGVPLQSCSCLLMILPSCSRL